MSTPYRWTMKAILTGRWLKGRHHRGEPLLNDPVAEILQPSTLPCQDLLARRILEGEHAEKFCGVLEILGRELHTGAPECVRHGRGAVCQHGHIHRHRFDKRHAESFVLTQ